MTGNFLAKWNLVVAELENDIQDASDHEVLAEDSEHARVRRLLDISIVSHDLTQKKVKPRVGLKELLADPSARRKFVSLIMASNPSLTPNARAMFTAKKEDMTYDEFTKFIHEVARRKTD